MKLKLDYKKVDARQNESSLEKNVEAYRGLLNSQYMRRVDVGKVPSARELQTIPSEQSGSTNKGNVAT